MRREDPFPGYARNKLTTYKIFLYLGRYLLETSADHEIWCVLTTGGGTAHIAQEMCQDNESGES